MRFNRLIVAVLLGVVVAMGAFAAGAAEQRAPVDNTIHIALTAPLTGDWSEYGQHFQRSVTLAIEQLNAQGGVLGRQFRLSVGDTRGVAAESTTLADRWVSDPTVVAQIGSFSSGETMAAQPVYDTAGMVQLSPTASHADYAKGSNWSFGIVGTQAAEGPFNARFAYNDLGIRRVAILYINNDWGIDTERNFAAAFRQLGGQVVASEFYFDGERDFTAVLTKLRETNADGLFVASFYNDGAAIHTQRVRLGWTNVKSLSPSSIYNQQLLALGGAAVDGVYTVTTFFADDPDPMVQRYVQEYRRRFNIEPSFHGSLAYDAMMLLADAIRRAGSTNRAAIRDAVAATRDFPGVAGSITFTPAGDAVKGYRRLVIRDGAFKLYQ